MVKFGSSGITCMNQEVICLASIFLSVSSMSPHTQNKPIDYPALPLSIPVSPPEFSPCHHSPSPTATMHNHSTDLLPQTPQTVSQQKNLMPIFIQVVVVVVSSPGITWNNIKPPWSYIFQFELMVTRAEWNLWILMGVDMRQVGPLSMSVWGGLRQLRWWFGWTGSNSPSRLWCSMWDIQPCDENFTVDVKLALLARWSHD